MNPPVDPLARFRDAPWWRRMPWTGYGREVRATLLRLAVEEAVRDRRTP